MALQIGIVGLPNVGKSTLFNALTKSSGAMVGNYPFCTIDPNVGVVEVPDARIEKLAILVKPEKKIPAIVEFLDIAGLVKGASQGEGLGNQFLANIRECDAIAPATGTDGAGVCPGGRRPPGGEPPPPRPSFSPARHSRMESACAPASPAPWTS